MRNPFRQNKLKCQKDYSLAKFHNIRKIFQMLDTNGDMVINYKDLENICEQYYADELVEIRDKVLKSFESEQKKTKQIYEDTHYLITDTSEKYYEKNKERRLKKSNTKNANLLNYKMSLQS